MVGPYIDEITPGPRPVERLELNRLAVIGRFQRSAPARLRRAEDVAAAGLPEGRVAAGLRAFFALGGREAVFLPSPDLAPVELPEGTGLVAAPEADGDWALLKPLAEAAGKAGAMLLVDTPWGAPSAGKLEAWRKAGGADWKDAAAVGPWLLAADGTAVPPSVAAAGVVARIEHARGVWKAPSGLEANVDPLLPAAKFGDREQLLLNPLGVNLFRSFPGRGTVLWGARTLSTDPEWRYVSVRRTVRMVEQSLLKALQWVVFEPNDEPLWADARAQVDGFLHMLFRQGAFQGSSPRDGYYLRCDRTTMTQADIAAGRLLLELGLALVKPAEFLTLRLQVQTAV